MDPDDNMAYPIIVLFVFIYWLFFCKLSFFLSLNKQFHNMSYINSSMYVADKFHDSLSLPSETL